MMRKMRKAALGLGVVLLLSSCGALTGIPGHGGGKRFAIEQEMVAASARGALLKLDMANLHGKRVNLYLNAIGDVGTGNLIGGRLSFVSQIRGNYIHSPATTERYVYPRYDSSTSSSSSTSGTTDSSTSSNSTTSTLLNSPEYKSTQQKGRGGEAQTGVDYEGLGRYQGSEEISSDDLQYFAGLLRSFLFLSGVYVVPPSEAEVDVYVTVDVFGTVRSREDWLVVNHEILQAKTSLEVMAVNHQSGEVVFAPQNTSCEAEYDEKYFFWSGPFSKTKKLKETEPLLIDFSGLGKVDAESGEQVGTHSPPD